ncbi:MAG: LysM peptidoglycan-binding domain-containing M23 family metallopeptidase [Alphaproteobacteria bacterium]|nr:LysM peptidoglycan-binding domain-containing M23 family metallopeptidase [Alphaproteobacteria bacterium]
MKPSTFYCLIFTLFLAACLSDRQAPAPAIRYGAGQGAGSAGLHTVLAGETLWNISQRYHLPMQDIVAYNNIAPPFKVPPGTRLRLPPPREYKVKFRDSMSTVSRLFGVSASELARLNDLAPPYTLRSGQVLRLPSLTRQPEIQMAEISPPPPESAVVAESLAPPPGETQEIPPPSTAPALQKEQTIPPAPVEKPEQIASAKPVPKSPIVTKTPRRSSGRFLTPVQGKIISSYGPKEGGLFNDGINIKAPEGAPVRAAENGVVVYAGNELKGSGNLVLIRHEGRWMTAYAHMGNFLIRRGDVVKKGQAIGTVGATGSVDAPQLHFEVRRGTEAINPKMYLEG